MTNNGTAYITALDWLTKCYGIWHIWISAYNSHTNGIVEQQLHESIVKACEGDISKWPVIALLTFWTDQATTHKLTGHSPFYMDHGIEPELLFDITLATFLVLNIANPLSTVELIAMQILHLQRCKDNLAAIHTNVFKSCLESIKQFEWQYKNNIHNFDF